MLILNSSPLMPYKKDVSLSYLNHLQTAWYANELMDARQVYALFNNFKSMSRALYNSLPLFFIIDYTAKSYVLMTDELLNIAGYHPGDFLEAGLAILLDVFHKEDFPVFNSQLFVRNAAFLKSIPQDQHNDHLFTYNFRFTRKDKKVSHVMQKSTYITSASTGLPLYNLGTITDITDFKTDTAIVHTIEKFGSNQERQLVERNFYYPHPEDARLSQRERDVLGYMAEGYSSKQIADKLNIAEKTIFNHRQNMLRKTNTKNVAELVAYSIRKRII